MAGWKAGHTAVHSFPRPGWNILTGEVWGKMQGQEPVTEEEGLRILEESGGLL